MEDPDMTGEIKVLSVKKEKGCYLLKVKFRVESEVGGMLKLVETL